MRRSVRSATGFTFTEGPIWHPGDHYLLFSDMPADVRRRWDAARGVAEVKRPSNKCNGMTYDADLNLIVCEHATSSLVRERPDGRREILASHFERPGTEQPERRLRPLRRLDLFLRPLVRAHARSMASSGRASLASRASTAFRPAAARRNFSSTAMLFDQPNGLCFSPDEQLLYVNDTVADAHPRVRCRRDGSLSNGRIFASGIRSSLEAGRARRHEMRPARQCLGDRARRRLGLRAERAIFSARCAFPRVVANLAWGGPDFQTLFMTATHSVYRVKTRVGPRREPYMNARPARPRRGRARAERPAAAAVARAVLATEFQLDPSRCALIIQDMQNDVIGEGGAFASSGAPAHARAAERGRKYGASPPAARARGVAVIHVWFVVEPGAPG